MDRNSYGDSTSCCFFTRADYCIFISSYEHGSAAIAAIGVGSGSFCMNLPTSSLPEITDLLLITRQVP